MAWSGFNTRRHVRASFECIVAVKKGSAGSVFRSNTVNVSIGGLGVILEKELMRNTIVELQLFLPDELPAVECEGRIVWSLKRAEYVKQKPGQFDTGIEFIDISEQDKNRINHIIDELAEY